MDAKIAVAMLVGFAFGVFLGGMIGSNEARLSAEKEAVHRSVGTYDANGKFVWTVDR